jgi:hypothetical protein
MLCDIELPRRLRVILLAAVTMLPLAALAGPAITITVEPRQTGAPLSDEMVGVNMANWYDVTAPGGATALTVAGIRTARWPGGSAADLFHWRTNTSCRGAFVHPNATYDRFMTEVARPARLAVSVTLNYGTNAACNGPGDAAEALSWIDHALSAGDPVVRWTIGNEVYGPWEADLHAKPHDAATYARAVAEDFYPSIKNLHPDARVGVVVKPKWQPDWDRVVLARAKYDFVELHFYAQEPGQENDGYLLHEAPKALATELAVLKRELATAGRSDTPVFVGEVGSVSEHPGKQSMSITQALFAGLAFAEMMSTGVSGAAWWLGFGGCGDASTGNFASSLYGWQDFGGYMIFSDGTPEYGCPKAPRIARGVPFPTARVLAMLTKIAHNGDTMLGTTIIGIEPGVRAYAMTHGSDVALLLFNLNQTGDRTVAVSIDGVAGGTGATLVTYDRALYDRSRDGLWVGPVTRRLGEWNKQVSFALPPWSVSSLILRR